MRETLIGNSPTRRLTHADRREAVARRVSASEALLAQLEEALGADVADPATLLAAVRALIGVSQREPQADLMVSIGPDHRDAVRLRHLDGRLRAELVRTAAAGTTPVVLPLASVPADTEQLPEHQPEPPTQPMPQPVPQPAAQFVLPPQLVLPPQAVPQPASSPSRFWHSTPLGAAGA